MFRINKLTDYGFMVLAEMGANPVEKFTPVSLAESLSIPKPTIAKVLKQLTRAGILESIQGKNGGYQLKISLGDLSVAKVLTALEGPIAITECNLGPGVCKVENHCRSGKGWQQINRTLYSSLENLSLANFLNPVQPVKSKPGAVIERRIS